MSTDEERIELAGKINHMIGLVGKHNDIIRDNRKNIASSQIEVEWLEHKIEGYKATLEILKAEKINHKQD